MFAWPQVLDVPGGATGDTTGEEGGEPSVLLSGFRICSSHGQTSSTHLAVGGWSREVQNLTC